MQWSNQQSSIFNWFEHGGKSNHLVIRARAGTGKSTTVLEGVSRAPEKNIIMTAFNKKAAEHLQKKISNPYAKGKTLHSLGFEYVRKYWNTVKMSQSPEGRALGSYRVFEHSKRIVGDQAPEAMIRLVAKLATISKETVPLTTNYKDLEDIAYAFDCVPDIDWEEDGWDVSAVAKCAFNVMERATQNDGTIDYADMLFLPIRNRWIHGKYDMVVVDEAQDMNQAQIIMAQKSVAPGGRIIVVGDDRQAIYGFRGADSGVLDRIRVEFNADVLGLTTTYRCPRCVVNLARKLVHDYNAAPGCAQGEENYYRIPEMMDRIRPGDFLLSRTNAPLAGTCLNLLRSGIRARVQGQDIGEGLIALSKKWKSRSMPEFLSRLANWKDKEIERCKASGSRNADGRIDRINDQFFTLVTLSEGLTGLPELQSRIKALFSDDGSPAVMCSSIHKAKGLEADNVFVLTNTLRSQKEPPCECGHWQAVHKERGCQRCGCEDYQPDEAKRLEEINLEYVALTRAMKSINLVSGDVQ